MGLSGLLNFAVFAKDVGASKPDVRIFQAAMDEASKLTHEVLAPVDYLMVGDSYAKDFLGATAIGMRALWLDNPDSFPRKVCGQKAPDVSDCQSRRIQHIRELQGVLDTL